MSGTGYDALTQPTQLTQLDDAQVSEYSVGNCLAMVDRLKTQRDIIEQFRPKTDNGLRMTMRMVNDFQKECIEPFEQLVSEGSDIQSASNKQYAEYNKIDRKLGYLGLQDVVRLEKAALQNNAMRPNEDLFLMACSIVLAKCGSYDSLRVMDPRLKNLILHPELDIQRERYESLQLEFDAYRKIAGGNSKELEAERLRAHQFKAKYLQLEQEVMAATSGASELKDQNQVLLTKVEKLKRFYSDCRTHLDSLEQDLEEERRSGNDNAIALKARQADVSRLELELKQCQLSDAEQKERISSQAGSIARLNSQVQALKDTHAKEKIYWQQQIAQRDQRVKTAEATSLNQKSQHEKEMKDYISASKLETDEAMIKQREIVMRNSERTIEVMRLNHERALAEERSRSKEATDKLESDLSLQAAEQSEALLVIDRKFSVATHALEEQHILDLERQSRADAEKHQNVLADLEEQYQHSTEMLRVEHMREIKKAMNDQASAIDASTVDTRNALRTLELEHQEALEVFDCDSRKELSDARISWAEEMRNALEALKLTHENNIHDLRRCHENETVRLQDVHSKEIQLLTSEHDKLVQGIQNDAERRLAEWWYAMLSRPATTEEESKIRSFAAIRLDITSPPIKMSKFKIWTFQVPDDKQDYIAIRQHIANTSPGMLILQLCVQIAQADYSFSTIEIMCSMLKTSQFVHGDIGLLLHECLCQFMEHLPPASPTNTAIAICIMHLAKVYCVEAQWPSIMEYVESGDPELIALWRLVNNENVNINRAVAQVFGAFEVLHLPRPGHFLVGSSHGRSVIYVIDDSTYPCATIMSKAHFLCKYDWEERTVSISALPGLGLEDFTIVLATLEEQRWWRNCLDGTFVEDDEYNALIAASNIKKGIIDLTVD